MSVVRLLSLVEDLINDPALGLAAKVEAIEPTVRTPVRSAFRLYEWLLPEVTPTDGPQVLLRFGDASIDPDFVGEIVSDGREQIEVAMRTAHSDKKTLQNEVAVYADAVRWMFNDLRTFSELQPDPKKIIVVAIAAPFVIEPLIGANGTFNGFLATVTIQERSTYV
jgi:hypothetical protein